MRQGFFNEYGKILRQTAEHLFSLLDSSPENYQTVVENLYNIFFNGTNNEENKQSRQIVMALVCYMKQRNLSVKHYAFQVGNNDSPYNTLGDWLTYIHANTALSWLIQQDYYNVIYRPCVFIAVRGWVQFETTYFNKINNENDKEHILHKETVINTIKLLLDAGSGINKSGTGSSSIEDEEYQLNPLEYGLLYGDFIKFNDADKVNHADDRDEQPDYYFTTLCNYLISQGAYTFKSYGDIFAPEVTHALKVAMRKREQQNFDTSLKSMLNYYFPH